MWSTRSLIVASAYLLVLASASVPESFDWRNHNGINWLTPVRNQHVPHQCGSCSILAATGMLSDRIKIQSNMSNSPEVMLSAQVIKNCASHVSCHNPASPEEANYDGGHLGGSVPIYKYMMDNGIPDESCAPYMARDEECSPATSCYICFNDDKTNTTCSTITDYSKWYVSEYDTLDIQDKDGIRAEIMNNGPVHCATHVVGTLRDYKPGDVYMGVNPDGEKEHGHAVVVVGWGTVPAEESTDGKPMPYWLIRNSWGSAWGDNGFFKWIADERLDGQWTSCDMATPSQTPAKFSF